MAIINLERKFTYKKTKVKKQKFRLSKALCTQAFLAATTQFFSIVILDDKTAELHYTQFGQKKKLVIPIFELRNHVKEGFWIPLKNNGKKNTKWKI